MASVRFRNGKYYYRVTISDQNGHYHWLEHGGFASYDEAKKAGDFAYPLKRKHFKCTKHVADLVFERFPEGHPAHIPLWLIYFYGVSPKDVYNLKLEDLDFEYGFIYFGQRGEHVFHMTPRVRQLLTRHLNKINQANLLYLNEPSNYVNVYLNSGRRIKHEQIYYISKVCRKQIHPYWNWRDFRI